MAMSPVTRSPSQQPIIPSRANRWLCKEHLNNLYHNAPDGLAGNEDCGQMSAWYVLSALGVYPICPGKPEMTLTMPLFDSLTVSLGNDRKVRISRAAHAGVGNY